MKHSVLLVDDEDTIRNMLRMVLEFSGYHVHEAIDGIEALEKVAEHKPDVLLLDVMMPRMDGLTVCRQLRLQPDTAQLPILLFSGKTQEEAIREGLEAGADQYICKPASPSEIVKIIDKLLEPKPEQLADS